MLHNFSSYRLIQIKHINRITFIKIIDQSYLNYLAIRLRAWFCFVPRSNITVTVNGRKHP